MGTFLVFSVFKGDTVFGLNFISISFYGRNKAGLFVTGSHFQLSLIFAAKLEHTRVEPLNGLYSNGRLLALQTNIRLGWK
jgi:hypothetical protein